MPKTCDVIIIFKVCSSRRNIIVWKLIFHEDYRCFWDIYGWDWIGFAPFAEVFGHHENMPHAPLWHWEWSDKIRGYSFKWASYILQRRPNMETRTMQCSLHVGNSTEKHAKQLTRMRQCKLFILINYPSISRV